jgi:hypothetical protein
MREIMLYIDYFDRATPVLCYEPQTGMCQLIARRDLPAGAQISAGFFVQVNVQIIAVLPSVHGPLLHTDTGNILLTPNHTGILTPAQGGQHFGLFGPDGKELFALNYEPPVARAGDLYGQEPSELDFFAWLAEGLCQLGFFRLHTLAS